MNKKMVIIVTILIILIVILFLWFSGIIPKQIARIFATNYLKKNFPKMQLEFVDIEWSSSFRGYSIRFKDQDNEVYGFIMNNKYLPITLGQGLFGLEEKYREKYENQDTNNKEEYTFYGKIIEANSNYILVEPNEDEEIRKSADKISIGLGENNDMVYPVGTNVKITYAGEVMESYPAQVNATNIEIKTTDSFELQVYEGLIDLTENKPYKILSKDETNKCDYDVYCYNVSAEIMIDGKQSRLRDALLENKITMDEIIARANKDIAEKKITGDMYNDGGSMIYKYDNYTILKCHTEDGNRDVYIGTPEMTMNDVI